MLYLFGLSALSLTNVIVAFDDVGELLCNNNIYGKASEHAADGIVAKLPFSNPRHQDEYNELVGYRTFAEPRFLTPQYSAVGRFVVSAGADTYPIAQLPRVWKKRESSSVLSKVLRFWVVPREKTFDVS